MLLLYSYEIIFSETYFETGNINPKQYNDPVSNNHVESLVEHLPRFARPPLSTESLIVHPDLNYKGYMDCCTIIYDESNIRSRSKLALIDWKSSQKPKESLGATFDNPLQLAAYIGAFNHDTKYPFQVTEGLIVIVYNSGRSATLLPIRPKMLEKYWKAWLHRLYLYKKSKNE